MTPNDPLNNFLVHLLHRPERLLRIPNLFYKLLSFFSFKRFLISHGLYTQRVGSKSILLKLPPRPFWGRKHFHRSQRISSVKWCVWSKLEMPPTLWCHQFEFVTNLRLSPISRCQQNVTSSAVKKDPINILRTSKRTSFTKTDKTYINILQIGVLWLAKYVEQILACYKSLFQPRFWELQQF